MGLVLGIILIIAGVVAYYIALSKNLVTLGYLSGGVVVMGAIFLLDLQSPKEPTHRYECPCNAQDLVVDEVVHYNKTTGDTTITTYIDVSDCVELQNNNNE